MDNTNNMSSDNAEAPVMVASPAPKKKQGGKIAIISLLCLLVGAAGAVAVIVGINGGFEFGKKSNNNVSNCDSGQSDTPSSSPSGEEKEITDSGLVKDLTEKANYVIAGAKSSERSISFRISNTGNPIDYVNMSDELKAKVFLEAEYAALDSNSSASRMNISDLPDSVTEKKSMLQSGGKDTLYLKIDDSIKNKYKKVFGEELKSYPSELADLWTGFGCNIKYVSEINSYVTLTLGCGGSVNNYPMSYQYKYAEQGNKAYVYFALGTIGNLEYEDYYTMSDITHGDTAEGKVRSSYKISSDNYKKYAHYRAVFEKDSDGNYVYKTFEKVND